jgi:hypothetical protein
MPCGAVETAPIDERDIADVAVLALSFHDWVAAHADTFRNSGGLGDA